MAAAVLVVSLVDNAAMASVATATTPSGPPISVGAISDVSAPCTAQNAEVEQAVDPSGGGYVYEAWTGCGGIGFSRSTDGGATFSPAVMLPGSLYSPGDPDVAVAPDGTVYVSFMTFDNAQNYPVVDASFDHGATFPQVTPLVPPHANNWGDSPNLTVGPDGTVYITWDYGPSSAAVVEHCTAGGSCSFTRGDLNVVIQASTDEGETFSAMVPISPGFPWSGGDNAPIVVDATGRLDVLYQGYPTNPTTHALSPALNYFTSSTDGGQTWSAPVAVGPEAGTMNLVEWWNEPSLAIDAGGTLYAAWDTQGQAWDGDPADTGWLSYSTDGGATWSTPAQGPADTSNVTHIMEVTGGAAGQADVAWLSDSNPQGYALYVRPFSVAAGWLGSAHRISKQFGNPEVWPGDTFGLSLLSPTRLVVSWGSAVPADDTQSVVFAAAVNLTTGR